MSVRFTAFGAIAKSEPVSVLAPPRAVCVHFDIGGTLLALHVDRGSARESAQVLREVANAIEAAALGEETESDDEPQELVCFSDLTDREDA